uniref:Si:ch211-157c3.4 n=1 Tax=Esox lucius TaxID=8010 RepID=A0AAY5KFB7_ESOLU
MHLTSDLSPLQPGSPKQKKMSITKEKDPPPYILPVEGQGDDNIKVYHPHTPFNPPGSTISSGGRAPVFTSGGGGIGGGDLRGSGIGGDGGETQKPRFVSYETELGRTAAMTTCTSCQQQVMTNVTYKVGAFAWLMCLLFICFGLILGCCLIPFFLKHFKDAYHSCPRCNRILHVDKKRCC